VTAIPELVAGIIKDFKSLVKQQLLLTRQEVIANLKLRGLATAYFSLAIGLAGLAMMMFCQALAHGLHWWTLTVSARPPGMPLAACFGIVGGVLLVLSIVLLSVGQSKLRSLPALPQITDEQN